MIHQTWLTDLFFRAIYRSPRARQRLIRYLHPTTLPRRHLRLLPKESEAFEQEPVSLEHPEEKGKKEATAEPAQVGEDAVLEGEQLLIRDMISSDHTG